MKKLTKSYFHFILNPFFKWWWALITGLATLLSYVLTPTTGFVLSNVQILVLTLICLTLIFLTFSIIAQGWVLFSERYINLKVRNIQKDEDTGNFIFVLESGFYLNKGNILQVQRKLGDIEILFAIVEIISQTDKGYYQSRPLFIKPAHLRDYTSGKFAVADLNTTPLIEIESIQEINNE